MIFEKYFSAHFSDIFITHQQWKGACEIHSQELTNEQK